MNKILNFASNLSSHFKLYMEFRFKKNCPTSLNPPPTFRIDKPNTTMVQSFSARKLVYLISILVAVCVQV